MRVLGAVLLANAIFASQVAAHSIQDGAEQLDAEQVAAVIHFLESDRRLATVHEPSAESSLYFFREIAQGAGELGVEVERVLLMFEAIRLGIYDGEQFADDADIFTWYRLIHTGDYPVVSSEIERLHEWFAKEVGK